MLLRFLFHSSGFMITGEPGETFVQPIPCGCAGRLYIPISISKSRKPQLLLYLMGLHCFRQILLVRKYENYGIAHLPVVDDPVQLLPRLINPVPICAIHYENEPLGAGVVMPPERSNLVLSTHVSWNGVDGL